MKAIVFDSSTIISLVTSCLAWILRELKKATEIEFLIPRKVYEEVVVAALRNWNYKLEGVRVLNLIGQNILKVEDLKETNREASRFLNLANNLFYTKRRNLRLIHYGEAEAVGLCKVLGVKNLAVDEKTTRLILENPEKLKSLLESKLHMKIRVNERNLRNLRENYGDFNVLRSTELLALGYEKGVFANFLGGCGVDGKLRRDFLLGALRLLKLNGCAIGGDEINEYMEIFFGGLRA